MLRALTAGNVVAAPAAGRAALICQLSGGGKQDDSWAAVHAAELSRVLLAVYCAAMKLSAPLVTTRSGVTQCPWTHPTQWPWTRRHLTRYTECYLYLNSRMDSSPNAVNLHGRMKLTLHVLFQDSAILGFLWSVPPFTQSACWSEHSQSSSCIAHPAAVSARAFSAKTPTAAHRVTTAAFYSRWVGSHLKGMLKVRCAGQLAQWV